MTHHIQSNEAHDDHVELFVGDDSKDNRLRAPTGPWKSFDRFLVARLLHGGDVLLLVLRHEGVQRAAAFVLLFIELVDNDTDKEIEGEEAAEDDEEDEVHVHVDAVLSVRLFVELELRIPFYT